MSCSGRLPTCTPTPPGRSWRPSTGGSTAAALGRCGSAVHLGEGLVAALRPDRVTNFGPYEIELRRHRPGTPYGFPLQTAAAIAGIRTTCPCRVIGPSGSLSRHRISRASQPRSVSRSAHREAHRVCANYSCATWTAAAKDAQGGCMGSGIDTGGQALGRQCPGPPGPREAINRFRPPFGRSGGDRNGAYPVRAPTGPAPRS